MIYQALSQILSRRYGVTVIVRGSNEKGNGTGRNGDGSHHGRHCDNDRVCIYSSGYEPR